ncbi:MAG: cytochrome c peroxidase [Pirellulales bacterium]
MVSLGESPLQPACLRILSLILASGSVGITCPGLGEDTQRQVPNLAEHLRRPVALIVANESLQIGNRRSGTITVVELADSRIVAEHAVAERIADMAKLNSSGEILVVDDAKRRLLKVSLAGQGALVRPIAELPVDPSKVCVATDRREVYLTAKWPRRVMAVTFDKQYERAEHFKSMHLPFAPQELLLLDNNKTLLIADAFGGQIAIVDVERWKLGGVRELEAHNIRGLAVTADGKRLHVAHQQMIHTLADYEELHWGRMVKNVVQVLDVDKFLSGNFRREVNGWLHAHGNIGGATGDPAGVITGPGGTSAVALSGVGEVAVCHGGYVKRISVGERPEALAFGRGTLYVANRFGDSVSIIDLKRGKLDKTISLGPAPELTAAERGEKLFYDASLSHDGWMSCHSCHPDGHSGGLLVDTLGDGDYGAPKRVPSLLGTRDTGPWGWTGRVASLGEQVRSSVLTTMHGGPLDDGQALDLVAFLESLPPPPAPPPKNRDAVHRGRVVFRSHGCEDCHKSPLFTSKRTFDVGLADERKRRSFNPPSLRGVSQRARFFHDGRASSLEDVLLLVRHKLAEPLSEDESAALLAYLRSL